MICYKVASVSCVLTFSMAENKARLAAKTATVGCETTSCFLFYIYKAEVSIQGKNPHGHAETSSRMELN